MSEGLSLSWTQLVISLRGGICHCPHCTDEETETPGSHGCAAGSRGARTEVPAEAAQPPTQWHRRGRRPQVGPCRNTQAVRKKAPYPHLQDLPVEKERSKTGKSQLRDFCSDIYWIWGPVATASRHTNPYVFLPLFLIFVITSYKYNLRFIRILQIIIIVKILICNFFSL